MIKIKKFLENEVYELFGEAVGKLQFNDIVHPIEKTSYLQTTVRCSAIKLGSTITHLTPYQFEKYRFDGMRWLSYYEDFLNNPLLVFFHNQNGTPFYVGVVDPDSIEYDYVDQITTFKVVSPLFLVERRGPFGSRNAYRIKPISHAFTYPNSGVELELVFANSYDLQSFLNVGDYIEFKEFGALSITNVTTNPNGTVKVKISSFPTTRTTQIFAKVESVYTTTSANVYFEIRLSLQSTSYNLQELAGKIIMLPLKGANLSDSDYYYVRPEMFLENDKIILRFVNIPKRSGANWNIGTTVRLFLFSVSPEIFDEVLVIDSKVLNFDVPSSATHISVQSFLTEFFKTVSPFFNSIVVNDLVGSQNLDYATVFPKEPFDCLKGVLTATQSYLHFSYSINPSTYAVTPTATVRSIIVSETPYKTISKDKVISIKETGGGDLFRYDAVRVRYVGDNLNKPIGAYPLDALSDNFGRSVLELKAATAGRGYATSSDGRLVSNNLVKIAERYFELYRKFRKSATIKVVGTDVLTDCIGRVVRFQLPLPQLDFLWSDPQNVDVYVNKIEIDYEEGTTTADVSRITSYASLSPSRTEITLTVPHIIPTRDLSYEYSLKTELTNISSAALIFTKFDDPSTTASVSINSAQRTGTVSVPSSVGNTFTVKLRITFSGYGDYFSDEKIVQVRPTTEPVPDVPIAVDGLNIERRQTDSSVFFKQFAQQQVWSQFNFKEDSDVNAVDPNNVIYTYQNLLNSEFDNNSEWTVSNNNFSYGFSGGNFYASHLVPSTPINPTISLYQTFSALSLKLYRFSIRYRTDSTFTGITTIDFRLYTGTTLLATLSLPTSSSYTTRTFNFVVPYAASTIRVELYVALNGGNQGEQFTIYVDYIRAESIEQSGNVIARNGILVGTDVGYTRLSSYNSQISAHKVSVPIIELKGILESTTSGYQMPEPPQAGNAHIYYDPRNDRLVVYFRRLDGTVVKRYINFST